MATIGNLIALNSNGLKFPDLPTIINLLSTDYQNIYGIDIDLSGDAPAGQIINIQAQTIYDLLQFCQGILSSFDPDQAQGILQDSLYKINNIFRNIGTYTYQEVQITIDRAILLPGLDTQANILNPMGIIFTIADNNGQQFYLLNSQSPSSAGTYTYIFRAQKLGAITTQANTITNPITILIGINSINNIVNQLKTGIEAELDSQFRIRRQLSTAINARGWADSIYANLMNLPGVTDVKVYENSTEFVDSNGLKKNSMYIIVDNGTDIDIANILSMQKPPGVNMNGNISVPITNVQKITKNYLFDRPQAKILYIKFDIRITQIGQSFNINNIKNYLINNLIYKIGDFAETSSIIYQSNIAINNNGGGGIPINMKISKNNIDWVDYLEVDLLKEKWIVNSNNIFINILS